MNWNIAFVFYNFIFLNSVIYYRLVFTSEAFKDPVGPGPLHGAKGMQATISRNVLSFALSPEK